MNNDREALVQQPVFSYAKENVLGVFPYIRNSNSVGTTHWMIIFTSTAAYFVYCGMDRSFMPGRKGKKLEQEAQNKNLEELLKSGRFFYRIAAEQISSLHNKKGWFSGKVWFTNSEKYKILIKLKKTQYTKFLELLPLIKASGVSQNLVPVKEITKESLYPSSLPPVLTEEEQKQEKRRRKALGWVLLINSILGLAATFWLGSKGLIDSAIAAGIVPAIIDISIAIALFKSKVEFKSDVLQWIFIRALLGFVAWGGVSISKHDWVTFGMQIPYFAYLIYHSKVKASARSFRIAVWLIAVTAVVFVAGTAYGFNQGKQTTQQYLTRLMIAAKPIDNNFSKQQSLVFFKSDRVESDSEIKIRREEILSISAQQKNQLEQVMPLIEEGLNKFPDAASQKYLSNLNTLYQLETAQNQAVADLFGYIDSVGSLTLTPEQQKIYDQKEQAVYDAYAAVRQQGLIIKNSQGQ